MNKAKRSAKRLRSDVPNGLASVHCLLLRATKAAEEEEAPASKQISNIKSVLKKAQTQTLMFL